MNSPPLPFGNRAASASAAPQRSEADQNAANFRSTFPQFSQQLPPGTTVQHPVPPFPAELHKVLEDARRSGCYAVTVTVLEPLPGDPERLTSRMHLVGTFKPDWLRRTWQTITRLCWTWGMDEAIFAAAPQAAPPPPAPPSESGAAAG